MHLRESRVRFRPPYERNVGYENGLSVRHSVGEWRTVTTSRGASLNHSPFQARLGVFSHLTRLRDTTVKNATPMARI